MNEIWEFFSKLTDTADFPLRWHCGYWTSFHGWLYIISDLAIWGAYFAIPVLILRFVSRRNDGRFIRLYFLFAAFILACGSTHLLDALTFWYPVYRINALVKLTTAVISWITVFNLFKLLPVAFTMKTADELETEIMQRKKVEEQLRVNNFLLTEAQEIARLGHWQWDVRENKVTWSDMTLKLYGLPPEKREMSYSEYLERIHPEDKNLVNELITQSLTSKVFTNFYHRTLLPDGQVRVFLGRGDVITDDDGQVVKMIGTVQDITEIKNTEYELLLKTQR
ncbi:MAG: PAS domain S-box protein, partial [Chitinophagia bacterium]|nr:PAS domain S-box protein [Chitinophagia bacterium]